MGLIEANENALVNAGSINKSTAISIEDEIGELAEEFNNMTERLQQFEGSILGEMMAEKNKSVVIVKNISEPLIVLGKDYYFRIMHREVIT
jgi:nitrate/nitrite-specific signal transduction histidine kinase